MGFLKKAGAYAFGLTSIATGNVVGLVEGIIKKIDDPNIDIGEVMENRGYRFGDVGIKIGEEIGEVAEKIAPKIAENVITDKIIKEIEKKKKEKGICYPVLFSTQNKRKSMNYLFP